MAIIGVILVTVIVSVFGGGLGWLVWLKTRPKKMTWIAKCYQVGEGVRPPTYDSKGRLVSDLKLNDLIPYIEDRLERTEKEHGVVVYRLQRLNMTTNAVTADMVDVWGDGKKEVRVLVDGSTATLMKQGYDRETSTEIFQPMPRERIELIKSEIAIKKDRLNKEKDILAAITPWIVAGMVLLGCVGMVYLLSNAWIKMAEENRAGAEALATEIGEQMKLNRQMWSEMNNLATTKLEDQLGKQKAAAEPPPPESIE